jgi:lambda repressor-like predicted transcriptional regulator
MPGKRLTPAKEIEATTLREAGFTLTAIAERVDVSVSSLQRLFKRRSTAKGIVSAEAVDSARQNLLSSLTSNERIKEEVARIISDDMAHSRMIREKAAVAMEAMNPSDTAEAALAMRALVAYSTLIKNTSDTLRNDLRMSGASIESMADDLPDLVIREMTKEDIEAVKKEHKALIAGS